MTNDSQGSRDFFDGYVILIDGFDRYMSTSCFKVLYFPYNLLARPYQFSYKSIGKFAEVF